MPRDTSPYFPGQGTGLSGAVVRWQTVVPDDDNDLPTMGIGLRNNGPLTVAIAVEFVTGDREIFHMAASHEITTSVKRVLATGTDAGAQIQVAFDR